jgi:hypothetical protein
LAGSGIAQHHVAGAIGIEVAEARDLESSPTLPNAAEFATLLLLIS